MVNFDEPMSDVVLTAAAFTFMAGGLNHVVADGIIFGTNQYSFAVLGTKPGFDGPKCIYDGSVVGFESVSGKVVPAYNIAI